MGIRELEQLSNEQVGAAAKALLLTWLIMGEEAAARELEPPHALLQYGSVGTLQRQADEPEWDDELVIHCLGYADGVPAMKHDRDTPVTAADHDVVGAVGVLAALVAQVLELLGS